MSMTLSDALNQYSMVKRPSWQNKAVVNMSGMMLLMTFDKDQICEWADGQYGQAVTDQINADDYERADYDLVCYSKYRMVGQCLR